MGFDLWGGNIPWRKKWLSIPVFLPGKSHLQKIANMHYRLKFKVCFLNPKSLVPYLHIQQKRSAGRLVWMSTLVGQLTGTLRTCFGRWPGSWRISNYLEIVSEWNTLNSNSKHVSIHVAFYKAFSISSVDPCLTVW